MSEFDFMQFSEGAASTAFFEDAAVSPGPYIPGIMDCMGCGMCVSQCPTYGVIPEENYSPRGRIRLIERVLHGADSLNEQETEALNACTLCRACESVCPSKMANATLHQQATEAIASELNQPDATRLLLNLVASRRWVQRLTSTAIHVYQRSGTQRVLKKLVASPFKGSFPELEKLLPDPNVSHRARRQSRSKTKTTRGEVALFTGCVGNVLDTRTHSATIKPLTGLGYDVHVLEQQTCCGAIHAHNGDTQRARACARQNIKALTESGMDTLIFDSSGCGAFLSEYPKLFDGATNREPEGSWPLPVDAMEFVTRDDRIKALSFRELDSTVAVHEPCSQRNTLKNQSVIYAMLENIPGLKVETLAESGICCGARGTKMLTQPALAGPLREEKAKLFAESKADLLISTNLTCALNLSRGIRESGRRIEVMHPVRLLAQQLI